MLRRRVYYWLYEKLQVGEFDGIGFASPPEGAAEFAATMQASLELIRTHDLRRYCRAKDHICWIVNAAHHHGAGGASYHPYLRRCKFDFSDFGWGDTILVAAYYAGAIVHEATHGWLCARGLRYARSTRLRHERICHAEQNRFLKLLDRRVPGVCKVWWSEFDPDDWNVSWTFWRRKGNELRRLYDRVTTEPSNEKERGQRLVDDPPDPAH